MAREESRRTKAMHDLQRRLYTNITHEFRTPLTVIEGMAGQINQQPEQWLGKGVQLIQRNTRQLLRLVNQMLDLAKLDDGELQVHWVQTEIVGYLRYLTESFRSLAETRQIHLTFHTDTPQLTMDTDTAKLEIIVSNLLSNAIKFTDRGGRIEVAFRQKNAGTCTLQVTDTGRGIPADQLPHIFQRFFQAGNTQAGGTGIGLAITRELLELLDGQISVDSRVEQGTTFTVTLPARRRAAATAAVPRLAETPPAAPLPPDAGQGDLPRLLLIEDNPDVAVYLRGCLEDAYALDVAPDGITGIEAARRRIPDIILCDVMLPGQDGFTVTHTLKQDERTSHIPIILLTARADAASRRTGLRRGADAYLSKPFDREELRIRLQQLVALRRRLQEKYRRTDLGQVPPHGTVDPELRFLKRLEQVVLDHLDNESFRVEPDLCRAMTMSRPQLYRKLKALRGCSPSEFIRQVRLQQAHELLSDGQYSIQEVAVRTGFKDASHFARLYKAHYGHNPSQHPS